MVRKITHHSELGLCRGCMHSAKAHIGTHPYPCSKCKCKGFRTDNLPGKWETVPFVIFVLEKNVRRR